jgi:hypothetical protein
MSDKRKLTPFLAHEMLFDFATGQLDPDRRAAVEAFIQEDAESQHLLDAIRKGLAYADSLKSIELTDEVLLELDQSENFVSLSKRIARWSEWPDSLRWSIIAVAISVCTAALVVLIPWKSMPIFKSGPTFDSGTIEMARVEPRKSNGEDPNLASNPGEDVKEADSGPLEGSGDEEFSDEASGAVAAQHPVQPPIAFVKPTPPPKPTATPVAFAVAKPTPKPAATPLPTPAVVAVQAPTTAPVAASASSKASRSFVYRAFMTLGDLEDLAPKITQQIKELGAEKAGEVELGWRRGSGRYYHFTIPEANEQKLLENLRVYGPVRISKDPHPRVMPEGQVRFILWIESGT